MDSLLNNHQSSVLLQAYDSKKEQAAIANDNGQLADYRQLSHEATELWQLIENIEVELGHS